MEVTWNQVLATCSTGYLWVVERRCAVAEFDHAVAAAVDWPPWAGNLVVELWPIPGGKFLAIGTFMPQRGKGFAISWKTIWKICSELIQILFPQTDSDWKRRSKLFFCTSASSLSTAAVQQLELIRHLDLQQPWGAVLRAVGLHAGGKTVETCCENTVGCAWTWGIQQRHNVLPRSTQEKTRNHGMEAELP